MDDYSDIINLSRPKSKRLPMSLHDRAAQFAPFAALSGYEEAIAETARLTDSRPEPDEETAARLNEAIKSIMENISKKPKVTLLYFVPDELKEGGAVLPFSGSVRRVDLVSGKMIFTTGEEIPLGDVIDLFEER